MRSWPFVGTVEVAVPPYAMPRALVRLRVLAESVPKEDAPVKVDVPVTVSAASVVVANCTVLVGDMS
jgi:hypothetical protein